MSDTSSPPCSPLSSPAVLANTPHVFDRLVRVMARLLAPDGCPWDREQTMTTLGPFLLEETYEVLDVMDANDPREHCEELGDLMMQIVFQAALRQQDGAFDVYDVCEAIVDKLVRRHPHVFGDVSVDSTDEVLTRWEQIKAEERRLKRSQAGDDPTQPDRLLRGVPRASPALARAQRLAARAARAGFDWPSAEGCRAKVEEELLEVDAAVTSEEPNAIKEEIGDLLFATVSLARKYGVDAEDALRSATDKFVRRFEHIEDALHARGSTPSASNLEEMNALWNEAKA